MQIVLLDRLESIGITPKRMARFAKRLSEAVDGFVAKRGDSMKGAEYCER